MIDTGRLTEILQTWMNETVHAAAAADWLLRRSDAGGRLPNRLSFRFDGDRYDALVALFSRRYLRVSSARDKCLLHFTRWEADTLGDTGHFLPVLAGLRGR